MLPKKSNFKDIRQNISAPLAMSTNLRKKVSNFSNTPKKIIPGQILGQDNPEKNAKCWFEAARIRVFDRHRSTKPTTAPWNLNGARSLGAPTHPLVTVFTKRPRIRGGRRPGIWYKHIWALLCRKQATKILDPSQLAKNRPCQVWDKSVGRRGQLLAP